MVVSVVSYGGLIDVWMVELVACSKCLNGQLTFVVAICSVVLLEFCCLPCFWNGTACDAAGARHPCSPTLHPPTPPLILTSPQQICTC